MRKSILIEEKSTFKVENLAHKNRDLYRKNVFFQINAIALLNKKYIKYFTNI